MGNHIKVSTHQLRDIGRSLETLKSEFDHSTDIVDSYQSYIGSRQIADALDDFAGDWSRKKRELCKGLEDLGKTVTTAANTYDGVDDHLASALLKAEAEDGGNGK